MAKNSLDEVYRSASNLVKSKYSIVLSRSTGSKSSPSKAEPKSVSQGNVSPKTRG